MVKEHGEITSDTTVEALLEDVPSARAVLIKYFGAGVTMPGQTWTRESLARACLMRGVDGKKLVTELRKLADKK